MYLNYSPETALFCNIIPEHIHLFVLSGQEFKNSVEAQKRVVETGLLHLQQFKQPFSFHSYDVISDLPHVPSAAQTIVYLGPTAHRLTWPKQQFSATCAVVGLLSRTADLTLRQAICSVCRSNTCETADSITTIKLEWLFVNRHGCKKKVLQLRSLKSSAKMGWMHKCGGRLRWSDRRI
jgi:hypothetical protein